MDTEGHNGCLTHFSSLKLPRNLMYFCWLALCITYWPPVRELHTSMAYTGPSLGIRTQRAGSPGVYYKVVIRGISELECHYDISHFFNHEKGQTTHPPCSCIILPSLFAAMFVCCKEQATEEVVPAQTAWVCWKGLVFLNGFPQFFTLIRGWNPN